MRSVRNRRSGPLPVLSLYGAILLGTLLLFLYVTKQVTIVSLERSIHGKEREAEQLTVEVEQLQIEASNLRKGTRIREIAMRDLGLVMPEGLPGTLF